MLANGRLKEEVKKGKKIYKWTRGEYNSLILRKKMIVKIYKYQERENMKEKKIK